MPEEIETEKISSRQEEMKNNLLNQQMWIEEVGMKNSGKDIPNLLSEFCDNEILVQGLLRPENDVKRHFLNWIKKQKESDGTVDAFEEYAKLTGKRY